MNSVAVVTLSIPALMQALAKTRSINVAISIEIKRDDKDNVIYLKSHRDETPR